MKGFFRRLDEIDAVIKRGGSRESSQALVSLMTDSASAIYALNNLDSTWLEPLESLSYFRDFPLSSAHGEETPREFWAASGYLKKVAKTAQDDDRIAQALRRILSFMPTPKSFATVRDMVDISLMLPREMRRGIVPVVQRALSTADNVPFANVSALVNSLAAEGDISAALRLFATLFAALPPEAARPVPSLPAQTRTLMDSWNYRQEMSKCLAPLMKAGGLRFLRSLCKILDEHLRITASGGFQGPDDFSYIWRPAIEEHDQNTYDDQRDTAVNATRDCAMSIASENPSSFLEIVDIMESQQWSIFSRIALFLLAESPSAQLSVIAKYSTEPYLFSEVGVRHEYSLLLKKRFKILSLEHQGAVLKMIENGPDVASYAAYFQRAAGRPATEEEITSHQRRWQLDWLSFIEADLPKEWKEHFDALEREFGGPEHPSFPFYSKSTFGEAIIGSQPAEPTEAMTLEMLLEKFPRQGAADAASEQTQPASAVLGNLGPEDYATIKARSRDISLLPIPLLDQIVSAAVLSSTDEPAGTAVQAALNLVLRVAERAATEESVSDRDALLQLTTRVVYELVPDRGDRISVEQLPMLIKAMSVLLSFVRTDGSGQRKNGLDNFDPLHDAINCVSGRIIDAGLRVALLERRLRGGTDGVGPEPEWLLSSLSALLSRIGDSEMQVSAILGHRFPWLTHLSPSWAAKEAPTIFPLLPARKLRWAAAWYSYIMYSGAYDDVFGILQAQYAKAVSDMLGKPLSRKIRGNPESGLGQHLAAYYWRGRLNIDDPLFQDFARTGNEASISTFLATIGRGMKVGTEIPLEALRSLRVLAEWIVSKWKPRRKGVKKALSAFGWWIPNVSLGDPRWRLELLKKAAAKAGTVQNPDRVLKILEELASDLPDLVISCLRVWVLGSSNDSTAYFLATRSEQILEKAIDGASSSTLKHIEEIADHFGSLGHFDYRRFATTA